MTILLVAIVLLGIIMTALYAFGILIRPTRMPFASDSIYFW